MRVGVNTVFGIGGVLDLASEMGVERHYEDFGQTLGVWGMDAGAYLVWPLIGPSSVRDSLALPLDYRRVADGSVQHRPPGAVRRLRRCNS